MTEASLNESETVSQLAAALAEARSNTHAVIQVIQAIGKHTTTAAVVSAALQAVRDAFQLDYGACWMIDTELQATSFFTESGNLGPDYDEINRTNHYTRGKGITGRTWANRDLIFIPDLSVIKESQLVDTARAAGAVAAVSFPFMNEDEVIGVLFFMSFCAMSPSQDRLDALRNIGILVGEAFATIRLLERGQRQQKELREAVQQILTVVQAAETGDLSIVVPDVGEGETGQIARGLSAFLSNLRISIRGIIGNAVEVTESSLQLSQTGTSLVKLSDSSCAGIEAATAASQEVSKNIGGVATGSSQMLDSIRDILQVATQASAAVQTAVQEAGLAATAMGLLGRSSFEIDQTVRKISAVAKQTRLLALNASIEAARAGAAGAGFNVVANEVKELARVTGQATEEIIEKIDGIREQTESAIASMQSVSKVVAEVNDMSHRIVATVDEQSTITARISQYATEAAAGSSSVAGKMAEVASVALQAKQAAEKTQTAAQKLTEMAVILQSLVSRFRVA